MSDFWKGVLAVLTLQWLTGKEGCGCGECGGCLTTLILLLCTLIYFTTGF